MTRPFEAPTAAAEVHLQDKGHRRAKIHATDYWCCIALCGLTSEPLLPSFRDWEAPAPVGVERCLDCLSLIPIDTRGETPTLRPMAPDDIWTWTGSVFDKMTVATSGIWFLSLPHLYPRRRFLPWDEIKGFAPRPMGSAPGGGHLWFPELVPRAGSSPRLIWIPGVLYHSEDEAQRATTLVNAALRLV